MRACVLLRGAAGCGKSTWVEENGLGSYTLSTDTLRLLFQSPILDTRGKLQISQKNDHAVWDTLFNLLERRMERGEFSIIDATHSRAATVNKYKGLAQKYRYRFYVVDFSEVPEEEILKRNAQRDPLRQVPEDAIRTMVARIQTQSTPTWTTTIKPDDFWAFFGDSLRLFDFNKWRRIHHIGDIHGSYQPLKEYFDRFGFNQEDFYIFVGDYFDRGIQNVETFNFLKPLVGQPNTLFLEGNHERWLWAFANDEPARSKEFENVTKPQFINANVEKSDLREFYRRLGQFAYYEFGGKWVFVNHGGLPLVPTVFTATEELIKGVGDYEDIEIVEEAFNNNEPDGIFQIHGHRNPGNLPLINGRCFNLCHKVEFGGYLRAVILDKDGFTPVEIKNTIFAAPEETVQVIEKTDSDFISALRSNRYIQEKKLIGNVSSFTFTREAFLKGKWNDLTTKARGLFVNIVTGKVVARAYEKFFNVNETQSTKVEILRGTMQFPATAYVKENGFLGIVGYDDETDELLVTSKTTNTGPYQEWFQEILLERLGDKLEEFKQYLKDKNVSFVFEVVDPVNDPHIIKYSEKKLFLLDIFVRSFEPEKYPYQSVVNGAGYFGFDVKQRAYIFDNWAQFYSWYEVETERNYDFMFNGAPVEGFVIECADGFMFKVKTEYYKTWKMFRNIRDKLLKQRNVDTAWFITALQNRVYFWMKNLPIEVLNRDIVALRDMFEAEQEYV